jgi:hypothetical protein
MYSKANAKPISIASGKRIDKEKEAPFSWNWNGVHFSRISPGIYDALCANVQGPQLVKAYGRWSLRVGFWLPGEQVELSAYLNFGKGNKITRNGRYFTAWCQVNGSLPDAGQSMSPKIFLEDNLLFRVMVEDATLSAEKGPDGKRMAKPEAAIYSRVLEIVSVQRG